MLYKGSSTIRSHLVSYFIRVDPDLTHLISKVTRTDEFNWTKHLSYRVDDASKNQVASAPTVSITLAMILTLARFEDIIICQGHYSHPYGYEYLGAGSRLVVTAQSERVSYTVTNALAHSMGGALTGPAGVGKTQTATDLSKALAVPVLAQSCSAGCSRDVLGKLLRGVVQTGAWIVLEHLEAVTASVLSVMGAHLEAIRLALASKNESLALEGRDIKIHARPTAFLTALLSRGKTSGMVLPMNLQAYFRPIAMTVPEEAQIIEVLLLTEGLAEPKHLSRKLSSLGEYCGTILGGGSGPGKVSFAGSL